MRFLKKNSGFCIAYKYVYLKPNQKYFWNLSSLYEYFTIHEAIISSDRRETEAKRISETSTFDVFLFSFYDIILDASKRIYLTVVIGSEQ